MAKAVKQRSLTEDELLKLEKMELSDDEDDFQYTNVEVLDDDDDDDEVDFQAVLRNLNKEKESNTATEKAPSPVSKGLNNSSSIPPRAVSTQVRPSVVDDFIRNFLIKISMPRTLDTFNTEWYELMAKGKLKEEDIGVVPDIYLRNQALDDQVKALRKQLDETKKITEKAKGTWDKFRHQRDVHKMHHQRVVQEKNSLLDKIKKLRKNIAAYEPLLAELRTKYEVAMKEKMLMRLERDRYMAKTEALEAQVRALEQKESKSSVAKSTASPTKSSIGKKSKKGDTKLPTDNAPNPHADKQYEVVQIKRVEQIKVFQGHLNSIAAVAFHPKNPVLATVSDDETWKLWSLPNCELIMSGEGHRDWIAGIEFHPRGTHIATSSGDNTIKLWDFVSASCTLTLQDHAHPVWESAFHHEGDFLASSSMDHTCKLWDLHTGKCRKTFRGHVDSVNSVCFQPYTVNICTGSGDKTVSIWDIRSGLCVQTFYGHQNTCNSVAFSLTGDTIASCDADGFIKLWDVRMVAERATIDGGQQPLNSVAFDKSGQVVAAASDDGTIKMCNAKTYEYVSDLRGHEGPVQSVKFDPVGRYIASASSDCTFRLWA